MATEILRIPEESIEEVVRVIMVGLKHGKDITLDTRERLTDWCESMGEDDDGSG